MTESKKINNMKAMSEKMKGISLPERLKTYT
jgi:hypothetical protein